MVGIIGRRAYGLGLGLIGGVLLAGGGWLLIVGGSAYYILAGLTLTAVAILLWNGRAAAALLYAGLLVATVLWAVFESGLDRWALMARLVAPAILGLPFLLPSLRGRTGWDRVAGSTPAIVLLLVGAVVLAPSVSAGPGRVHAPSAPGIQAQGEDWLTWGGDNGGARFSKLDQITPANVGRLQVAWTYRTGVPADGKLGNLEVTPLKVGERLFVCNNMSMVDALDPETGKRLWRFDPKIDVRPIPSRTCRGVAYYESASRVCPQRVIAAAFDAKLWALDARTGQPCSDFGQGGMVDLSRGMGPVGGGYYYVTSAPTIVRGKIVVGGWVMDGQKTNSPSGVVRAYDAVTGGFAWAWDLHKPYDHAQPPAGQTYTLGTPNSWAPMSGDEDLGLVYLPTGNATPDYYGAQRPASFDRFSSSVVALDATSGDVRWSFQTAHHDLWDYDVSSQPTLIDLPTETTTTPALIQPTKRGEIFVLDRRTGKPLTQVVERPVPQHGAPGERLSPTQPFSPGMPSLAGPDLSEARMWGLTPLDQLWCRIQFRQAVYEGPMTPPQLDRTVVQWPGFMGAISWGGVSIDPTRGLMVVNSTRVPTVSRLVARSQADAMGLKPRGAKGFKPVPGYWPQAGVPYAVKSVGFLSPLGVPCSQPPFGLLTAIDLHSRQVVWERPLGTARDSGPLGLRFGVPLAMGVPNTGGSAVTAGGLAFIGATQEASIRAVDLSNGKVVWSQKLPAGGQATPMTYRSSASGRQFVVIAAGGKTLLQSPVGDYLVGYALPKAP